MEGTPLFDTKAVIAATVAAALIGLGGLAFTSLTTDIRALKNGQKVQAAQIIMLHPESSLDVEKLVEGLAAAKLETFMKEWQRVLARTKLEPLMKESRLEPATTQVDNEWVNKNLLEEAGSDSPP